MRYIRYIFLAAVGLALVLVALANRQMVSLQLLPPEIGGLIGLGQAIELPLFLVILGGVLVGLLLGFVWEYLREFKIRSTANQKTREVQKLEREVKRLKEQTGEEQDDVLALLDGR